MNLCRICGKPKDGKTGGNICKKCESLQKKENRVRSRIENDISWLNVLHRKEGYCWEACDMDDKGVDYVFMPLDGEDRDNNAIAARVDNLLWANIDGQGYTLKRRTVRRWVKETTQ